MAGYGKIISSQGTISTVAAKQSGAESAAWINRYLGTRDIKEDASKRKQIGDALLQIGKTGISNLEKWGEIEKGAELAGVDVGEQMPKTKFGRYFSPKGGWKKHGKTELIGQEGNYLYDVANLGRIGKLHGAGGMHSVTEIDPNDPTKRLSIGASGWSKQNKSEIIEDRMATFKENIDEDTYGKSESEMEELYTKNPDNLIGPADVDWEGSLDFSNQLENIENIQSFNPVPLENLNENYRQSPTATLEYKDGMITSPIGPGSGISADYGDMSDVEKLRSTAVRGEPSGDDETGRWQKQGPGVLSDQLKTNPELIDMWKNWEGDDSPIIDNKDDLIANLTTDFNELVTEKLDENKIIDDGTHVENILGGDGEVVFDEFAQTYNTRGFNTWDDAWSRIKNDKSVPMGATFSYNNSLYKKELKEE